MRFHDSWHAAWEPGGLHISGTTDLFPNDFSTATLSRTDVESYDRTVVYALVFHRDKEPFCDKDRVGPVHFVERSLPPGTRRIRIILPESEGAIELEIPQSTPAT